VKVSIAGIVSQLAAPQPRDRKLSSNGLSSLHHRPNLASCPGNAFVFARDNSTTFSNRGDPRKKWEERAAFSERVVRLKPGDCVFHLTTLRDRR
jgi:hypothetical protein